MQLFTVKTDPHKLHILDVEFILVNNESWSEKKYRLYMFLID